MKLKVVAFESLTSERLWVLDESRKMASEALGKLDSSYVLINSPYRTNVKDVYVLMLTSLEMLSKAVLMVEGTEYLNTHDVISLLAKVRSSDSGVARLTSNRLEDMQRLVGEITGVDVSFIEVLDFLKNKGLVYDNGLLRRGLILKGSRELVDLNIGKFMKDKYSHIDKQLREVVAKEITNLLNQFILDWSQHGVKWIYKLNDDYMEPLRYPFNRVLSGGEINDLAKRVNDNYQGPSITKNDIVKFLKDNAIVNDLGGRYEIKPLTQFPKKWTYSFSDEVATEIAQYIQRKLQTKGVFGEHNLPEDFKTFVFVANSLLMCLGRHSYVKPRELNSKSLSLENGLTTDFILNMKKINGLFVSIIAQTEDLSSYNRFVFNKQSIKTMKELFIELDLLISKLPKELLEDGVTSEVLSSCMTIAEFIKDTNREIDPLVLWDAAKRVIPKLMNVWGQVQYRYLEFPGEWMIPELEEDEFGFLVTSPDASDEMKEYYFKSL